MAYQPLETQIDTIYFAIHLIESGGGLQRKDESSSEFSLHTHTHNYMPIIEHQQALTACTMPSVPARNTVILDSGRSYISAAGWLVLIINYVWISTTTPQYFLLLNYLWQYILYSMLLQGRRPSWSKNVQGSSHLSYTLIQSDLL